MYLKSIEIIGFKSFAQKTRLVFEPGITAVVGPNGCGKSNISDSIRWVLGEQRPSKLRATSMTDVIFNGTDSRKPLGMAEVSITFADCEKELGTEYNEVTVSRRAFRDGEGQYFINKTPCRLRDIQRLFMGTGVGTSSYSVMAQGQIDDILSSRPEDRRIVFEEAAGITRFKADRKEALRKLEQTDANLLRLADVIREVKRQIGSLQRQVGKARRYKEYRDELRGLDIWITAKRVRELSEKAVALESGMSDYDVQAVNLANLVAKLEEKSRAAHDLLMETEQEIGKTMETSMQTRGSLGQTQEIIRMNEQRVAEYRAWSQRDEREITETVATREAQEKALDALAEDLTRMEVETRDAEAALGEARENYEIHLKEMQIAREKLQGLQNSASECDRTISRTQGILSETEAKNRSEMLKRERLASEHAQLEAAVETFAASEKTLENEKKKLDALVSERRETLAAVESERAAIVSEQRDSHQKRSSLQSRIAALGAQVQMLEDSRENEGELPSGAKMIFDFANPLKIDTSAILGSLADNISAPKPFRRALEAALRPWLDAAVTRDASSAADIVAKLSSFGKPASARLIAASTSSETFRDTSVKLPRLIDSIQCSEAFRPAAERLLANVFIVDSVAEVPEKIPENCSFVTLDGVMIRSDGCCEVWMPEGVASNPLARKAMAEDARTQSDDLTKELAALESDAETAAARLSECETEIRASRAELDERLRAAAQKDGELQGCRRDGARSTAALEKILTEIDSLSDSDSGADAIRDLSEKLLALRADRDRISSEIGTLNGETRVLEQKHAEIQSELTEYRLKHSSLLQRTEHTRSQHKAGVARLAELDKIVQGRTDGLRSYEESIAKLIAENDAKKESIVPLEEEIQRLAAVTSELHSKREAQQVAIGADDAELHAKRAELDAIRDRKSETEVRLAETKMHRKNQLDRILNDYHVQEEDIAREPKPFETDAEVPTDEEIDKRIAELRSHIESLGPVNLVAIDEYREYEERHIFLTAQEKDLIQAKTQILEMIKEINRESSALFISTFEQAKVNFQEMFQKLFNGGTAQLVLLDSEDVLECGIDIIARPPGKRLQNISLLSGGERTMTAVALLFAIYKIKPSPFALLDELDAALDDSNIGRFVDTLKDFLSLSQFLIITHNQHTIAGSDIVYGVTMPEKGVSTIVSMRLKSVGVRETPLAITTPPPSDGPKPPKKRKMKKQADEETASADSADEVSDESK